MLILQRWRRDIACLGIGVLAGFATVLAGHSHDGSNRPLASLLGASTAQAVALSLPASVADSDDASDPRHRGVKSANVARPLPLWEQAAAAYRTTGGNPALARRLMLQLPPKSLRKLALDVASWPNTPRNQRVLREVFQHWAEVDPLDSLAQAQALPPALSDWATFAAMQGFASGNPAQAAAYFSAPPSGEARGDLRDHSDRQLALTAAMRTWGAQDPVAAAAYADGLPLKSTYSSAWYEIAADWAQQDPNAAMGWATGLTDPGRRNSAIQGIVSTWTQTDPQAAANYVLATADDASRKELVATLMEGWDTQNLADAARWTLGQTGDVQAKAAEMVVAQWARDDPAGAAAWAAQLPAGSARDEAFSSVASNWLGFDPNATENWLDGLSAGGARDAAIAGYATTWRNDADPADVLRRVETIDDPAKRDNTLVKVLNNWLEDHPQQAHQWINQANLSAAVQSRLAPGG